MKNKGKQKRKFCLITWDL